MNASLVLRYRVDIHDFGVSTVRSRTLRGLTLAQASRLVRRQTRRGFWLYGGSIAHASFGGRGGVFPGRYRSAAIGMDWLRPASPPRRRRR